MEIARPGGSGLLAPETNLHGRYRIVCVVGRGGMSAVYEAEHVGLGRRVAIKEMTAAPGDGPEVAETVQRFQNEARTLARLEHRYFPDVTDFFSEDGHYYLVMEYVDGETLEDLAKHAGAPMSEDAVVKWAAQLCDVLSYLHSQTPPVVFRDLKPSNIMIDKDGQVKLIDFGIARFFKPGKQSDTQSMGTAGYSAPEQYGTGQTDARSDIYSLGAVLHFLLTGRDPTASPFNFPPVRQLNPKVSANTERVVARCVNMSPDDRYRTAAEVKSALSRPDPAVEPETTFLSRPRSVPPAPVSPVPVPQMVLPPPPRSPVGPIALLVIGILALLGAAAYLVYDMHRPPAQVAVPSLLGQDQQAAQQALAAAQLRPDFQGVESSEQTVGTVTRQQPAPTTAVDIDSPVQFWVSSGPGNTQVPDVSQLPPDKAKKAIQSAHLLVGQVAHEFNDTVPKGYVIRSDPAVGMTLAPGQKVGLVVSDGPKPAPAPVQPTPAPAPTPAPGTAPPTGQPDFSVHVPVPDDGQSHQVQVIVHQTDNQDHAAYDDTQVGDARVTVEAPGPDAIRATVDGKPVTPDIQPVPQNAPTPSTGTAPSNTPETLTPGDTTTTTTTGTD